MEEAFTTVARFQYSSEAQIFKGRLEAEGIKVFLADALTIDADPLISNAVGGVKLKVHSGNEAEALKILNSVNKYSLNDEGEALYCPSCGSDRVQYYTSISGVKSFFFFILSFLMYALPIYTKRDYFCENCKNRFNLK